MFDIMAEVWVRMTPRQDPRGVDEMARLGLVALLFCLPGGVPLLAQTRAATASTFASLSAKANDARASDRLDEAVVLYRKALALRPQWAEGWWSLGTIQYERNAYRQAAEAFQKAVAVSPKVGVAWAMLGLCEFELGQDDNALQHIRKGTNLGIGDDPQLRNVVLFHEGALLRRRGWFKEARSTLRSLCWAGVGSGELMQALGMTALQMAAGKLSSSGGPDAEVVPRVGRAECWAGQKKYDEAKREYDAVVRDYPDYPNVHYAYGWFLLEAEDLPAGIREMEREIKNNPRHVLARVQIAAHLYKSDSAAGLPYAEQAVKLDPGLPLGHYVLGLLLLDTDDYARAIAEFEIAQRASPGAAKVYLALGAAYARAGRDEEAACARATFLRVQRDMAKEPELLAVPEAATVAPAPR
jgi:tetratricopeptide (TPR) repeat protein